MKKKIVLTVGVLFLAAMAAVTLAARNRYQLSLPLVAIDIPRSASVLVCHEAGGLVETGENGVCETTITVALESWRGAFPFFRGDEVTVGLPYGWTQGEIDRFMMTESAIEVTVRFPADGVEPGDSVVVTMEKQTREVPAVLPLAALQSDGSFFVWLVEETPGPWGDEYTVRKEYVEIWYLGVEQVALKEPISLPVVLSADGYLTEGQAVRFYP